MAHAFEETAFYSFGKFNETQTCVLESTRKDPDRTLGVEELQLVVDDDNDTGTWMPLREMGSPEPVVRPKERGRVRSPGAGIRDDGVIMTPRRSSGCRCSASPVKRGRGGQGSGAESRLERPSQE